MQQKLFFLGFMETNKALSVRIKHCISESKCQQVTSWPVALYVSVAWIVKYMWAIQNYRGPSMNDKNHTDVQV